MTKCKTNKKVSAFKGVAVLIIAAILALVFTGCPQSAGGSGGSANIEGVWKAVFVQIDNTTVSCPLPNPDGGKMQPYMCFWKGKAYSANEITENSDPEKNGLFKDAVWNEDYTFANGILTIGEGAVPVNITGNSATMSTIEEGKPIVLRLTRVSSPTVEEIKAAK